LQFVYFLVQSIRCSLFFFSYRLGLWYTISSSNRRIQYQSNEILLERDSTNIERDPSKIERDRSVLNATHKYFLPSSNQQCQILLEEDILIEIFVNKTKRGKPVNDLKCKTNSLIYSFDDFLGKIMSFLVKYLFSC